MPLTVREVQDDFQPVWDEFVLAQPMSCHYHQYAWRGFFSGYLDKETYYLAAMRGEDVAAVVPLVRQRSRLFGDYLVSLPFLNYAGIVAADEAAGQKLTDAVGLLAERLGVSHVELRGFAPLQGLADKTNKVAMRMNLPQSADELSSALGSKVRAQIKRPQRVGASVTVGGIEALDSFYSVFSRNMRDLGTPVYSRRMFAEILERFPATTDLVIVNLEGEPAAAGFLLHHRDFTEVPWASSNRRFNRVGVNMLLYWEMLKLSIEKGAPAFDFGRSTKDAGTYRFKKQWGAKPIQLHWSYWLRQGEQVPEINPQNHRYALAIKIWQRLPLAISNAVGPLIARNLP